MTVTDTGPTKINFTRAALDAVACPMGTDRVYVYDLRTPALALCVTAAGKRSFYVYRRVYGRPQRIRLGAYPETTIEQARKAADKVKGQIAAGKDPMSERRALREESTVGDLFKHYLDTHAKLHKRSWERDDQQFTLHLDGWRNRKLSTVRQADVAALHARIGRSSGHYAANRVLALLHTMFAKGRGVGFDRPNPVAGVQKFKEKSRERFVQADELPRFFKALADEPNETLRDFFLVTLLTGARRANVQAMRWDQLDLDKSSWQIPETKNGNPLLVHLATQAVKILDHRKEEATKEWVFPGRGKTGHLKEPKSAWARVLTRAKIADLRIHDLRRTLGSWQAAAGASLPIIGRSLGHLSPLTTAIYARLSIDPVRASVDAAAEAIAKAAAKKPKRVKKTKG